MATMSKPSKSIRELGKIVRMEMAAEHQAGELVKPCHVLRRDGDTDTYRIVDGRVQRERVAGHVTLGMWVDPSDLPCIICD